jgi:arylsulfatase A-like enzyme
LAEQLIKNIVVLSVDWLNISYLGAYGNTWVSTPHIDRLAAQSLVVDRAVIDTPQLDLQYRSLWQGIHAMAPDERAAGAMSLAERFGRAGWHTSLLTDEHVIANHPLGEKFTDRTFLNIAPRHSLATSVEETCAAEYFAAAIDSIERSKAPTLLWLHTAALGHAWDAPLEFREHYRDEDDPLISDSPIVPNRMLAKEFDPDELLQMTYAYAGQVSLLDELIGSLLGAIDDSALGTKTLFILTSPSGFPLGEHCRVGLCDLALYSELTHVPLILRFPERLQRAGRAASLIQPADLSTTILAASGLPMAHSKDRPGHGRSFLSQSDESLAAFDRACVTAPNQRAIITPAWSLRVSENANQSPQYVELFAKPDDWFEVNEVLNRCPEIAAGLQSLLAEFGAACRDDDAAELSKLPEQLIFGMD